MKTLCILGRQPALSLAELEACFGPQAVQPWGKEAAVITTDPVVVTRRPLGGSSKIAEVVAELPTTAWEKISGYCLEALPEYAADLPEGKLRLGLSAYGLPVRGQTLQRTALQLKKALRTNGRSARVVPNQDTALNTAQLLHNQLTGNLGIELILVAHDGHTLIARTIAAQDITQYARRDQGRPKRSGLVGMLPPKLAQIMLNMAQVQPGEQVLDPFCGTGVVLQEAALLGATPFGTDVEPKMVEFSQANLSWLAKEFNTTDFSTHISLADARTATWPPPLQHVVCETYLGPPMTSLPPPPKLQHIRADCNQLIEQFLINLQPQINPKVRCCIAVPAWHTPQGFLRLPFIDHLGDLGYNRVSFEHSASGALLYHRPSQTVARQLLILTRK